MTKTKDLTIAEKFKEQLNTPKTETRIVLKTEDLYPDLAVKKSKLSPAARAKVVNHHKPYQSQNQETYGPCSYWDCKHSTDFDLEITIEGNRRKWARRPNDATWLRGTWETGFWTSHYLSSWELWLADVDEARRVVPLLSNDTVYTVNLWGTHCAEDSNFCNSAMEFIRGAIRHHEQGNEVSEHKRITSNISYWSRYTFTTGAAIGASLINPGLAIGIGASVYGAGAVGQVTCDSERGKEFWNTISSMGFNSVGSGIDSFLGKLTNNSGVFVIEVKCLMKMN